MGRERRKDPLVSVKREVLAEAGYRCGNPACRSIIALDIHHLVEVAEGGTNDPPNLLALCPTCHALYHRGDISRDAVQCWKGIVVDMNHAFDRQAINNLLFLDKQGGRFFGLSGDGVLQFTNLIAAGIALSECSRDSIGTPTWIFTVKLTKQGQQLVQAWASGDREAVRDALAQPVPAP